MLFFLGNNLDKVVESEKTGQVANLVNEGDITAALRKFSDFMSKGLCCTNPRWIHLGNPAW